MKKIIIMFACLIASMFAVNAQVSLSVKQRAVNITKASCKGPSTFILTDGYGNKISVGSIKCNYVKGKIIYDSAIISSTLVIDSILYYKRGLTSSISKYSNIVFSNYATYDEYKERYYTDKRLIEHGEIDNASNAIISAGIRIPRNFNTDIVQLVDENTYQNFDHPSDSFVFSHYEIDETVYFKKTFRPYYLISFYYEAQNSYGGMVEDKAMFFYDPISKELHNMEIEPIKKEIGRKKYVAKKTQPKIIYGFHDIALSNYLYEKRHKIEHINKDNCFPYTCNICFGESSDHNTHFIHGRKYLSMIDKCRLCKHTDPKKFHLFDYHNELECLICKKNHIEKHKKKKKNCEWCKQLNLL